jgi:hypothetical protein
VATQHARIFVFPLRNNRRRVFIHALQPPAAQLARRRDPVFTVKTSARRRSEYAIFGYAGGRLHIGTSNALVAGLLLIVSAIPAVVESEREDDRHAQTQAQNDCDASRHVTDTDGR